MTTYYDDMSESAALNYLAGTTDFGDAAAIRLIAAYIDAATGTGSPEGVVTAPVGSTYIDTAATTGAIKWVKASGTGNTGWVVEYGDTGRRDIASSHAPSSNSWGCSSHVIRRVGPTVYYYLTLTNSGGSTVTGATTGISLPAEFRPPATIHFPAIASSGATKESYIWNSGAVWVYGYAGVTTIDLSLTWMTTAAWPSSLPGSAA